MSSAYYCELAYRSTRRLATDPGPLRERLPEAWDNGMSMINPDKLPEDLSHSRKCLRELRKAFSRVEMPSVNNHYSQARLSLHGLHDYPKLVRYAELMLSIEADLERHFELKIEGVRE